MRHLEEDLGQRQYRPPGATDRGDCGEAPLGILLAAGCGRRMGCTKQLVPWPTADGDIPLVAAAFDTIAPFCRQMVVVLAHDRAAVQAALAPREFVTVTGHDGEMFESLRRGLRAASALAPEGAVLLQLGDHPQARRETIAAILETAKCHPGVAVTPEFCGKGGHPILIPMGLVPRITSRAAEGGLRVFWQTNPELCRRFRVDDPGVVADIDTPDQLPKKNETAAAGDSQRSR